MFRKIPFHPILFAVYPILFLYSNNISMLEINHIFIPVIWSVFGVVIMWSVLNLFIRNRFKSSAVTSLITVLFFSYGHIIGALNKFPERMLGISSDLYLTMNYVLIAGISIYIIVKYFKKYFQITGFLNFISIALLAYPFIIIITSAKSINIEYPNTNKYLNKIENVKTNDKRIEKPDIFYIILDGYGREDVLKSIYNHDNESFLKELENRGFFIARESRSNYAQTLLSLASSLNMQYLDTMDKNSKDTDAYRLYLKSEIINNRVTKILRGFGYKFVTFSTGYSGTEIETSDIYLKPSFSLDEFQFMLIGTTPLYNLLQVIPNKSPKYLHRQRILFTIAELPNINFPNEPIFAFAHIIAPHPPFVLAYESEFRTPSKIDLLNFNDGFHYHMSVDSLQTEYKTKYIAQLKVLNKLVLDMLDKLLLRKNIVIVLQSDHGPGVLLNWEYPDSATLAERIPILNAYYFADSVNIHLYHSITPVNTFRLIFNSYFSLNLPPLEDKSFFSRWSSPNDFIAVD